MSWKKKTRGVNAKGRSKGESAHVRLYRWELESAAYRSLSLAARALLVELKALYNGSNNGTLFLSVRRAADRLGIGKSLAAEKFLELQSRGFIRPKDIGCFTVKCLLGNGRSTTWILTEHPIGDAMGTGSKDFMHWRPEENQNTVRPSGRSVHPSGQFHKIAARNGESVRPGGRFTPSIVIPRSTPADTDNIPRGIAAAS